MSVKDITWLLNSFWSYGDLGKILYTANWYTKFFLVYWLIACLTIPSDGINWHQNSNSAVWVVCVDVLSDPSFDRFGYFLVFLDTMWRTITTWRSTKITLKVIVLVQMLTISTYGCHGLLILVKTLFTLNDWYPSMSESVSRKNTLPPSSLTSFSARNEMEISLKLSTTRSNLGTKSHPGSTAYLRYTCPTHR